MSGYLDNNVTPKHNSLPLNDIQCTLQRKLVISLFTITADFKIPHSNLYHVSHHWYYQQSLFQMKNLFKILPGVSFALALGVNENPKYNGKSQLRVFNFSFHILKYQRWFCRTSLLLSVPQTTLLGLDAEGLAWMQPLRFQA